MNKIISNVKKIKLLYIVLLINIFCLKCTIFAMETSLTNLPEPILIEILGEAAQEGSFNQSCQLFSLTRTNKKFYHLLHSTSVTTRLENTILDKNEKIKKLLANVKNSEQANRKLFKLALSNKHSLIQSTQPAHYEHNFIVKVLTNRGANINCLYPEHRSLLSDRFKIAIGNTSPLFCAVACSTGANFLNAFLANGANANATNKHGITVLMLARFHGLKDLICPLLTHGADKSTKDNEGKTVYDKKYESLSSSISEDEFRKIVENFETKKILYQP